MGIDTERQMNRPMYCGIDPGRDKFGLAVGNVDVLSCAAVIPFENMADALKCLSGGDAGQIASWRTEGTCGNLGSISRIFIGNGTGHEQYAETFRKSGIETEITDERMTTLEARNLYWRLHPPKGLWGLLPRSLLVPPRPIDDLAAWIIMRRTLVVKY
jgi:RNase H-fold protein (predicted Holliday junction resolvase)